MQTIKSLAVASVLAVASTTAFAGGIGPTEETPLPLPPVETGSSAGSLALGSLGSLGGAAPAIVAAVVVAGVAASGGS